MSNTKWQIEDILIFKLFIISLMFLLSYIVTHRMNNYVFKILYITISTLIGYKLPDIVLKRNVKVRQKNIQRSLPTFIDFLTICVEAGLGIDIAIYRVINQMHGPLAEEVAKTMSEVKYGKTKKDAFQNLTQRVNVAEVTSFFNSLINGEQLGISLGNVLKVQGQEMREKRKQQIQEEAYKVPIKLLFPLVIFILPGIFIILLGPAAIQVYRTLLE